MNDTLFNKGFSEAVGLLEEMGFQSTSKLSFGDGGRAQMVRKTVPDNGSGNAETSCAEFRCCSGDLHVPQNGDRLDQRDSPSICGRAGNMRD